MLAYGKSKRDMRERERVGDRERKEETVRTGVYRREEERREKEKKSEREKESPSFSTRGGRRRKSGST